MILSSRLNYEKSNLIAEFNAPLEALTEAFLTDALCVPVYKAERAYFRRRARAGDAHRLVEDAGFEAVEAFDADKAIEILVARTDIRIVLTAVDMSGSMDGLKLAEAIRRRRPPIETIVMCDKRKLAKTDLPERSHFFRKPYDHDAMVAVLHSFAA